MFAGIIEGLAVVQALRFERDNLHITLQSELAPALCIDQSLSHNGICLTVVRTHEDRYGVTAVRETLEKSTLSDWQIGDIVNLERCLKLGDRLDGHMVQGHVDQTARCISIIDEQGSSRFTFAHAPQKYRTVEKGSIAVNGVSLTVLDSEIDRFSAVVIPYTYEHTNLHRIKEGDRVNLEFDILGKYIAEWVHKYVKTGESN